ncbi:MAG: dihydroorotase [Candidatus Raymondbacteria bacterium RifOxyA12_full_50_37]|uniref:Dihydroorotase n=1 Tax=Candidatus Raymondbacteria bacterium RIFOXYD12_FULL_49_13 TaxID=1817890 RepID=A0A1F7FH51_UNCRA|nr:MAG: dihydroorotase [Candidatus Raymondbacteria bacterium RifOxyA12_full_50_37]OGJ88930.1 MAG: dihydroorotase [Candidatus Raymondbacteria bacterium RIFOXYA2_FULL_49_16]OGK05928.1 MAG: dihydroorotase [Candidatus Raymondbacteria bacterium RIFOXYD12_FULL_49_13]OGP42092.1 MAG: dihydroorotase [Candidatus Raymondbacteria bacterium RIFOXYB2_FULL_49_35]
MQQNNTILIKGGRVISPKNRLNGVIDVLIANGTIEKTGKALNIAADRVVDAKGMYVVPGLIDMHCHFREPGFEEKETIQTGAQAAAAGGVTTVAVMPNTNPVVDNETVVKFIMDRARDAAIRVLPIGAISHNQEGAVLSEIGLMRRAGIVAVSEDGKSVMDSGLMKNAMRYCTMDDTLIISHCEDPGLSKGGVMNEGRISSMLGFKGIPKIAEEIMVARDIMIARDTGARIHIAHVSTKGAVELIRAAKKDKMRITAETAPHYFTLTDDIIVNFNPNHKMNPPLRNKEDVEAIIKALADGTIDAIATDHAPHTIDDKDMEFDQTPNGVVGLETSVGVTLTHLVHKKKITIERMVELMSVNPAAILKIDHGQIAQGKRADITIIDPSKPWTVDSKKFRSLGKNTPFEGMKLRGKAVVTIVNGNVVYEE